MEKVEKEIVKCHIDVFPLRQLVVQYLIWTEAGKDSVGYCLITGTIKEPASNLVSIVPRKGIKEAAIWHIYIKPEFRRKGYATAVILALKQTYDTIYAQGIIPDSKELLKDNGFTPEAGKIPQYRWTKKTDG